MFVRFMVLAMCVGCVAEVENQTEEELGSGSGSGSGSCAIGSGSATARNELVGASRYGRDVSIALAGGTSPWVSYIDVDTNGIAHGVHVARRGVGWVNELVDASGTFATSLASNGAVAYSNSSGNVRYAQRVAGVWNIEAVTSGYAYGYVFHDALAVDSAGRAHIVFVARDFSDATHLYHASRGTSGWTIETIANIPNDGAVAIAIDSAGVPRFGFYDLVHRQVHYYAPGTDTIVATLTSAGYEDDRQTLSLALDAANRPSFAFVTQTGDVQYATLSGSSLVDYEARGWPSLAFDCAGTPHIAYELEGLTLARKTATGFTYESAGTNFGTFTALAMDSYGHSHVAYFDQSGQIRYQFSP
jgi:hypothetical protein